MKAIFGLIFLVAGCSVLPFTGPDLTRPIMYDDEPLFTLACIDSIVPVPEGRSCHLQNIVTIVLVIPNPLAPDSI